MGTRRKETVLEEDEWIAAIEGIIERDFFPQGGASVDELQEKLRLGKTHSIVKEGLTLDQFLSRYTSEDNASFREILDASNARRREKMAHLLPPPAPKDYARKKHLPPMNMLMYDGSTRDSLPLSTMEEPKRIQGSKRITRDVNYTATSLHQEGDYEDGVGSVQDSKHARGREYSILETPRFEPGEDATPIMTWGTIDATPQRLNESPKTTGFAIRQTPQREQIAYSLGKNASASMESSKRSKRMNVLQSSRQGVPMSPAARRLAASVMQRKDDSQLKASYSANNKNKNNKGRRNMQGPSRKWNED